MTVEIIAEAAQGYEGDADLTLTLALEAAASGADAVKFQLVYADDVSTPDYQYYPLYKQVEMDIEIWRQAVDIVRTAGKRFYFDVGGPTSMAQAAELGVDGVKIHSTNFFNTWLVEKALESIPCVYVALGGIEMHEVDAFLDHHTFKPGQLRFLYGFQSEPTPVDANNLSKIKALQARFPGIPIGFMDHTEAKLDEAATVPLLALPYGIVAIEKHITIDRKPPLRDSISALDPARFKRFVQAIRRHECALGDGYLELGSHERAYRNKVLKVVVAEHDLAAGSKLEPGLVKLKRVEVPRDGPRIHKIEDALGKTIKRDIPKNLEITPELLS